MSEWPKTRIKGSSYLKGRIGWQGLRASEFLEEGPYLITGTDFRSGKIDWSTCYHVSEARFAEASYIHIRDNDLLITKDGTIGKIALVTNCPEKAVLNSGVFLLRSSRGDYDHGFAYFVLTSDIFETFLRTHLNGSTINHLYQYVFEDFEIPTPPLPTQQKIARILQTVDRAMEKTEALIEKYQQIKAGLMHDLFTRGLWTQEELDRGDQQGTPAEATAKPGQLRPTRQDAPHLYQETPNGWIPKAWNYTQLSALCTHEITYGIVQAGPHIDNGVPYIRTGDISGDSINADSLLRTSPRIAASFKRSEIRTGEIVCAIRATVGKVLTVPEELDGANLTQGTARVSPRNDVSSRYVLWGFRSGAVQRDIQLSIKGTTFNEITLGDLRQIRFPIPRQNEEQNAIGARLDACEELLRREKSKFAKLQKQKAGLMHDLLTGEVTVTPDPEETSDV